MKCVCNLALKITHRSMPLRWRHNGCDSVSNHQPHDCLLNRLFRRRSKKTSKLRVTSLCVGNSPGTGEFPAQMASNADIVSIWWRHHSLIPITWTTYSTGRSRFRTSSERVPCRSLMQSLWEGTLHSIPTQRSWRSSGCDAQPFPVLLIGSWSRRNSKMQDQELNPVIYMHQ